MASVCRSLSVRGSADRWKVARLKILVGESTSHLALVNLVTFLLHGIGNLLASIAVSLVASVSNFSSTRGADA